MPRPTKCRRVCHFPVNLEFMPTQDSNNEVPVILNIDEYEAIRLIDMEKLSQEQCSEFMQVARTTVQRIYENAREKLAIVLVEGRPLKIDGGDYWLCNGKSMNCGYSECYKHYYHSKFEKLKGDTIMRIAVTYENGDIFQHFGHTEQFKVYDVENGRIIASEVVDTNGNGHGALAGVLTALDANVLICGGIGGGAQMALKAAGIELLGGVSGEADKAVQAYIDGNLAYNPNVKCNHHEHNHGEGHVCGDHGCGSNHHCNGNHG